MPRATNREALSSGSAFFMPASARRLVGGLCVVVAADLAGGAAFAQESSTSEPGCLAVAGGTRMPPTDADNDGAWRDANRRARSG